MPVPQPTPVPPTPIPPRRLCGHCASDHLLFVEHVSGAMIYHCEACSRSVVVIR